MQTRRRLKKLLVVVPLTLMAAAAALAVAGWTGTGSYYWGYGHPAYGNDNHGHNNHYKHYKPYKKGYYPVIYAPTYYHPVPAPVVVVPAPHTTVDNDTATNTSDVNINASVNNTVVGDTSGLAGQVASPWFDLQITQQASATVDVSVDQDNNQN